MNLKATNWLILGLFLFENSNNSNFFKELAYLLSGGVMSVIYLICACSTFFGTKELQGIKD